MKYALIMLIFISYRGWSHGKEEHKPKMNQESSKVIQKKKGPIIVKKINSSYKKRIKPIFKNKCLVCHGQNKKFPWYYSLPLAKQLIDHDVKEAKKHVNMSNDFPFGGHGSPKDDLIALRKSVKKNSMPPLRYKIMHWDSSLTKKEKRVINTWITESLKLLDIPKN